MIIFPAIDLYQKKAVRLYKGEYARMTVYSDCPLSVAHDFEALGSTCVHLVDLEGAKDGTLANLDTVRDIAAHTSLYTEIGGGIRTLERIERYLECGVDRVIIGTAAVTDPDFLETAIARYGSRIAVGADVKDGKIAIKGWVETADCTLDAFLNKMQSLGIKNIICTDISRDGAMRGTNLELYKSLSERYSTDITASGGVSSIEDVKKLRAMNLYGAIIGKAYYTGDIDLREAIEVAR